MDLSIFSAADPQLTFGSGLVFLVIALVFGALGGAIGGNAWNVELDLTEAEYVTGERIKDVSYRYTLRVVAMDADPELNPWGLALDGYVTPPTLVAESSR